LSGLLECFFFLACIKMLLRCCIFYNPLMLVLILIYCIFLCFGSTSIKYINIFPIISSFHDNPLNNFIIMIPFLQYFCQKYWTVSCRMICCVIVHTCCWWMWTIHCIVSRLLEIVAGYYSSTSSTSSSFESSSIVLIFCMQCIILWCLIILWWNCKILCIIILLRRFSCH
jgi:hypothetical protein